MCHESKPDWAVAILGAPELNDANVFDGFVSVVRGCNQSQRGTVLDSEWLTVQAIGKEYLGREQVSERQA